MPIGTSICAGDYGAIDDGREGFVYATYARDGTDLRICSAEVELTVANCGPGGTAVVTMPGASSADLSGPQDTWVGHPIAIDGAGTDGGVFVSRVASFVYDPRNGYAAALTLTSAAPTPLTNSVQMFACPCFTTATDGSGSPSDVGKPLWCSTFGGMNAEAIYTTAWYPGQNTIAEVASPFAVVLSEALACCRDGSGIACRVMWGTDNFPAVFAAAEAALAGNRRRVRFQRGASPAGTGLYLAFSVTTNAGGPIQSERQQLFGGMLSSLMFERSDCRVHLIAAPPEAGLGFDTGIGFKAVIPSGAPGVPAPKVSFNGAAQLPRCSASTTINALVAGDSWADADPSGQTNAVWGPFAKNFEQAQRGAGKTVNWVGSGTKGLTWARLSASLGAEASIAVNGLPVTPDLACLFVTGGNDGFAIHRNDVQSCINAVASWPTAHGLPPDVAMLTGALGRSLEGSVVGNQEAVFVNQEYAGVLQRSMARVAGLPLVDVGRHSGFALHGWSEDALPLRRVPPPAGGTATPTAPLILSHQCRDFMVALRLGDADQTGAAFWSAAGGLKISLSAKPDNVMWLTIDDAGRINFAAVCWGRTVATTLTMAAGSALLTTSGQASVTPGLVLPQPPSYITCVGGVTPAQWGDCLLATGCRGPEGADFRSYVSGVHAVAFVCDGNDNSAIPGACYVGGQMFIASDAAAAADCIVQGAGAAAHPFTGADSLVTRVREVTSNFSATLGAVNRNANLSGCYDVFLGSVSVSPTCTGAVAAGADPRAQQVLVLRVCGTRVRAALLPGGVLQDGAGANAVADKIKLATVFWEGEVERFGGPFFVKVASTAGDVAVTPIYMMVDDRDALLRRPYMTNREAFGIGAGIYDYLHGGDGGHPSQLFLTQVVDEATASQPLAAARNYADTFGSSVPGASGYAIPPNQAFTELVAPAARFALGLPPAFPQGGRLEVFNGGPSISDLTVSPPAGHTIAGTPVETLAANATIAYRLARTVFIRVA